MDTFVAKFNQTVVYNDEIAFKITKMFSKLVWFGKVFFLEYKGNLYIPANSQGWKWVLDDRDIGINTADLKLLSNDEQTKSYLSIHFDNNDPARYPIVFTLNVPEFVGNFISVETIDEKERVKNFVHEINDPLEIGQYLIKFNNLEKGKFHGEISSINN